MTPPIPTPVLESIACQAMALRAAADAMLALVAHLAPDAVPGAPAPGTEAALRAMDATAPAHGTIAIPPESPAAPFFGRARVARSEVPPAGETGTFTAPTTER